MTSRHRTLRILVQRHYGRQERIVGAEIGVWHGSLSAALLRVIENLELLMVDPYMPWSEMQMMRRRGKHRRRDEPAPRKDDEQLIEALNAAKRETDFAADRRHMLLMTSAQAATEFVADESLDFVFIDANHEYEHVSEDIDLWTPKVRVGGIVSGHDYAQNDDYYPGVRRAVDERFPHAKISRGLVWHVMKE